ncbi:MAG: hypothetical protein HUU35_02925, partial [Armatimonadetes bacterium]|nr:hypothetical protein [Armatimonadota bacterium]
GLPQVVDLPTPPPPAAAPETTAAPAPAATAPPIPVSQAPWLQNGRVLLRYGGQPGEVLDYQARSEVRGNMTVLGQTLPLVVTTESGYRQEILDNQNGRLSLRLTMDPVAIRQDGLPFSGPTPTAPAPLTLTMEPNGRITQVEQPGGDEVVPVPGMPGGLTLDYRAITRQLSAAAFPAQPVAIGDTWRQNVSLPLGSGGAVEIDATCRLDGFEQLDGRPVARIVTQLKAPLTMRLTDPGDGQPIANVGSLSGTVTSHFDPAAGALVRSRSDLDLRMTMSLADGNSLKDLAGVPVLGDLAGKGGLTLQATGKVKQELSREQASASGP